MPPTLARIARHFSNSKNCDTAVKEELDGIDIDDIGNLEDLLRIVFIHEEFGNIKVFVEGRELTRNINKQKKPGVLQAYRCPLCDKCYRKEYFFNMNVAYCE